MSGDRRKFIKNHLKIGHRLKKPSAQQDVQRFVSNYLRQDGCFILRLIAHNTNNITTTGNHLLILFFKLIYFLKIQMFTTLCTIFNL